MKKKALPPGIEDVMRQLMECKKLSAESGVSDCPEACSFS